MRSHKKRQMDISGVEHENLNTMNSLGIQLEAAPSKENTIHFYNHFMSSPEKKTTILLQLQALKERAKSETRNMHPDRGKFVERQTVELFKSVCNSLGANHIIRMKALEIYDRFMAVYNSEVTSSLYNFTQDYIAVIQKRIETQCLLRICSCIQLAYKFHNDPGDSIITTKKIQALLGYFSLTFSPKAIKRSEQRVYKLINFKLNFVTTFDIIEHIIALTNTHIEMMQKIYHLGMKILDFVYASHAQIYRRVVQQKICVSPLEDSPIEFNLVLRGAGILACAFYIYWPSCHQEKTKRIAEICLLPEQSLLDFSSILVDELFLK